MNHLDDRLDKRLSWRPRMSPPASFTRLDAERFQTRINEAIGTRNGRPIVKLAWAPDELRWYPRRMEEDPKGYTFPIFIAGTDENGEKISAPRWVLLERIEPEQFARAWEVGRYSRADGSMWDWKGPCPSERYIELRAHCYHDGACCACHGDVQCHCDELFTCWGKYLDPNERLLNWIKETVWKAREDSDVKPTTEASEFSAPQAQRDMVTREQKRAEKQQAENDQFDRERAEDWSHSPLSISIEGLKRTASGIYLLE